MKKFIVPLLLIVLVTVSCKKQEFNGASYGTRVYVSVIQKSASAVTLCITTQGFTPRPSSLKIINRDTETEMPFAANGSIDLSSVKLQDLQSGKTYTICVLLIDEHDSKASYMSSDLSFTTK